MKVLVFYLLFPLHCILISFYTFAQPVASFTAAPNPAACNEVVTFDAGASYHSHPGHSIVSYYWDFGDGATITMTEPAVTHIFTAFGNYTVTLTVTDDHSPPLTDNISSVVQISLGNIPPVADTGGPYETGAGSGITLDGTASYDPNAGCGDYIVIYQWEVPDDEGYVFTGSTPFLDESFINGLGTGTFDVKLRVYDTFGSYGEDITTLSIYENQPVASFTAAPNPAACNEVVMFDAEASYHPHPGHSIVSYYWDFGDGTSTTMTEPAVTHIFTAFGNYTVTLTVTDDHSPPLTDNISSVVQIILGNIPPVADAGGPYAAGPGSGITLDGTASYDPDASCGDYILSYWWDVPADGVYDFTGSTYFLDKSFINGLGTGTFNVKLRVYDTFGSYHEDNTTLSIYDNQPVASFTAAPNPAACNEVVTFDAGASYHTDPGHSIVSYYWDFGDGATITMTEPTVTHIFTAFGNYTVTLTVTDDNSPPLTDNISSVVQIILGNIPPVADAGGPYETEPGSGITLDGTASYDLNAACGDYIVSYQWEVPEDEGYLFTGSTPFLDESFINGLGTGTFNVKLRVYDTFGSYHEDITTLSIYENQPVASFTAAPNPAECNEVVMFDAGASYHSHPGHSIVSYYWDFGDGTSTTMTEPAVTHIFTAFGNYTVTLTVTDDIGNFSICTANITVVDSGNLHYRTKSSGNWTSVSIWETCDTEFGSTWDDALIYPTEALETIKIRPGHTVTANQNVSVDQFTIEAGGMVTVPAGITLTNIGNSDDFIIESASDILNGSLVCEGTGTVSGTVTYNRYLDPVRWWITSAPVNETSGFSSNTSKISDYCGSLDFAWYKEADNEGWQYDWTTTSGLPGSLTKGQGYLIGTKGDGIISFTGTVNDNNVEITVDDTSTGGEYRNGWNAVGNPYTSAIGISSSAGTTHNLLDYNAAILENEYAAIYIWNQTAGYDGSQQYYKAVSNNGYTLYPGMSLIGANCIQAGQGFMVNAESDGGKITFTKSMQTHLPALSLKSGQTSWPGLTLLAEKDGQTRYTIIAFNERMTAGLDKTYDAGLLASSDFILYSRLVSGNEGVNFEIQCLPDNIYNELSVPIGLDLPQAGTVTFKAAGIILPDGIYPVLEDRLLKVFTPLKTESDSYTVNLENSTRGTGRFYLHFSNATSVDEVIQPGSFTAWFVNDKIVLDGYAEKGTRMSLFDMTGSKLAEYKLQQINRNEIPASGLSPGVYLLRIEGRWQKQEIKIPVVL